MLRNISGQCSRDSPALAFETDNAGQIGISFEQRREPGINPPDKFRASRKWNFNNRRTGSAWMTSPSELGFRMRIFKGRGRCIPHVARRKPRHPTVKLSSEFEPFGQPLGQTGVEDFFLRGRRCHNPAGEIQWWRRPCHK